MRANLYVNTINKPAAMPVFEDHLSVSHVATAGVPWPRLPRPPIKPGAGAEVLMAALVTVNVPVVGSPETARSHPAEGQLAGGMINASIEGYLAF